MRLPRLALTAVLVLLAMRASAAAPPADAPPPPSGPGPWVALLDPALSRWETYLSFRHRVGYAGEAPVGPDGAPLAPVGYNTDPDGVFTVAVVDGAPVLRISGEVYGSVFTREDYADYHLRLQVRWGERTWAPRADLLRDSGVLYHSVGENGVDYWRSWKLSQEFQVMEGHTGDYWNIANAAIDIRAFIPEGTMNAVASLRRPFLPFGTGAANGGFCLRTADHESPPGEWTTLDLIAVGDRSVHVVNGHVVMVLRNSRSVEDGRSSPLTRGRIQLQSEGAEVFYRDVRIRRLDAMPAEYAALFE